MVEIVNRFTYKMNRQIAAPDDTETYHSFLGDNTEGGRKWETEAERKIETSSRNKRLINSKRI